MKKLKAWQRNLKEMHDVAAINLKDQLISYGEIGESGKLIWWNLGAYDLLQETGLKDKNGKEIFEGDIIKDEFFGNIGEVKFSKDLGSCGCCYPRFQGSGFYADDCIIDNKCEIIGNIFQNPKLLKK